jgi:UDP:flavonoid glycosyltransferase YjiC (YdhE family)
VRQQERTTVQCRVSSHLTERPPTIVLYTSSHGFGHAVRCAILCQALLAARPDLRIVARTAAPAWIFPPEVVVEPCIIDAGVVQPNSLEIDAGASLARYADVVAGERERLPAEAARVRAMGARAVVADVPSAAFEIAARAGVPGIGLANFSWDWIYEPFVQAWPERAPLLAQLKAQYGKASRLLRLPFNEGLTAFPVVEDVPLIARRSTAERRKTRQVLGLPLDAPLVLFSFGGHTSDGPDAARLAQLGEYAFVATATTLHATDGSRAVRQGKNLFLLPQLANGYVDLLAASDVVITKPGYGIVADLIANRVPALYVSRGGFREEPVLVRALEEEARAVSLDRSALDALDLRPSLERLHALDRPWTERPLDGAEVAARRILALAGLVLASSPARDVGGEGEGARAG